MDLKKLAVTAVLTLAVIAVATRVPAIKSVVFA
jgi:hypothetical protein